MELAPLICIPCSSSRIRRLMHKTVKKSSTDIFCVIIILKNTFMRGMICQVVVQPHVPLVTLFTRKWQWCPMFFGVTPIIKHSHF